MQHRKTLTVFSALALAATLGASASASMMSSTTDRYGGPAYNGTPNLAATVEFAQDGGGAKSFSIVKALTTMVGPKLVKAEVAKLTKQYGAKDIASWVKTWNFAVPDAVNVATHAGVKLPAPANFSGKALAAALVKVGSTSGTFWTGDMLDHTISHKVHDAVMNDIDAKLGTTADANYHRITNQAMYDLAQALGATSVKLAAFH